MRITILGGTGFTGSNLVREAASRGHDVTSYSRSHPAEPLDAVRYETGSLLDDAVQRRAVTGADAVVSALSPRGEMEGRLRGIDARLAELAADEGVRLGVIGGFSGLRPAPGAARFADGPDVPPQFAAEAREMTEILEDLLTSAPAELDWFFVSPGAAYGAYAPGVATGRYRIGDDVALVDADGESAISGADFATAVIDELEKGEHRRAHFSVAY
ncbi:NAD(P)-dependent oxidoreductase [Leifsonia aquatica]|uniref:NAD(P)-dependent oxidoreductase n=1 Tax=Leifsonia aquatica TaxID=144185 RepID=UPI0004699A0A|nr:NAD(P)H-binding protein [Leifsonia aquatica]